MKKSGSVGRVELIIMIAVIITLFVLFMIVRDIMCASGGFLFGC